MTQPNDFGLPMLSGMRSKLLSHLGNWERTATVDTRRLVSWVEGLVRLENGEPFSFQDHEYLRGLYEDDAPQMVIRKAAQLGVTTWALLKAFHFCAYLPGVQAGIYYFPTVKDVRDFSRGRANPLAQANPGILTALGDVDSIEQKRIGKGWLYLRGLRSTIAVKSVAADFVIYDEVDEAPPDKVELARKRLAHSDFRIEISLGNPTLPDYAISAEFEGSDRRYYHLRCPGCSKWVCPDQEFPSQMGEEVRIIQEEGDLAWLACPTCKAELDLAEGEWVAERQESGLAHGYAMSHLLSSKVSPAEIMKEYRTTQHPQVFWNTTLGRPYADPTAKLTRQQVLATCGDEPLLERSDERCTMGVDVGARFHVVICRRVSNEVEKVVYIGIHREWSELDALMGRFSVGKAVVDALPELHATQDFVSRHPRKAWRCFFKESARGGPSWSDDRGEVAVNRVEALDLSAAAVLERRLVLPRRQPVVEKFAAQLTVDAKKLLTDEDTGDQRYAYVKTKPPVLPGENEEYRENHFRFALTYCLLAARTVGPPPVGWSNPRSGLRYQVSRRRGAFAGVPTIPWGRRWR